VIGILVLLLCLRAENAYAQTASTTLQRGRDNSKAVELYNQGLAATQKGDISAARQFFEAAVRANPKMPETQSMLGWVLLVQGQVDPAIAHLKEAIRLKPGVAEMHETLSRAYVARGDGAAAVQEAQTAVKLAPRGAEAHHTLANTQEFA